MYRIAKRWSFAELARQIGISDNILKRTLRHETVPRDYNEASFNDYFENHHEDIEEATGQTIGCPKNS